MSLIFEKLRVQNHTYKMIPLLFKIRTYKSQEGYNTRQLTVASLRRKTVREGGLTSHTSVLRAFFLKGTHYLQF